MATLKQMYDYLKLANKFEEQKYISQIAINKLSSRINKLNSVRYYSENQYMADSAQSDTDRKNSSGLNILIKIYLLIVVLFCIGALIVNFINGNIKDLAILYSPFFWAEVILFILILVFISVKKTKKAKKKHEANIQLMNHKLQNSKSEKLKNEALLNNYNFQLSQAKKVHMQIQSNLNKLYSEGILPARYQNFVAVATMYQWLRDGRCTQIYGHGGLFDTYEYDLRLGQIVGKLDEISRKLDTVIENQDVLYNEVRRGNEIAEKTYQSVCSIENNTDQIVKNTNQIKTNTNIIAMNSVAQRHYQEYMYYRSLYY